MPRIQDSPNASNPLLKDPTIADPLPPFADILLEDIPPALDILMAQAEAALASATEDSKPASYAEISNTLNIPFERLSRAWNIIGHLKNVTDTPQLRTVYNQYLSPVTNLFARLESDERLYTKYKQILGTISNELPAAQLTALRNTVRTCKLSGAELSMQRKLTFLSLEEELAGLSNKFSENLLDATESFSLILNSNELSGLPKRLMEHTLCESSTPELHSHGTRHKIGLQSTIYHQVQKYVDIRSTREKMYRAYTERAHNTAREGSDNSPIIDRIIEIRNAKAKLLGFPNYASYSLYTKMARTPSNAINFISDLISKISSKAQADLLELSLYAQDELGISHIEPWDVAYVTEKIKVKKCNFSEEEARPYFEADGTIRGVIKFISDKFNIKISKVNLPTYHEHVSIYRVDRSDEPGDTAGYILIDAYSRPGKQSGAWMDGITSRWKKSNQQYAQLPVAIIVTDFHWNEASAVQHLTWADVETLLHELGHALHHTLTKVDTLGVSGIHGVEWDVVEFPSQYLEQFAWDRDAIESISRTGSNSEAIPLDLFLRAKRSCDIQKYRRLLTTCLFALYDLDIHSTDTPIASIRLSEIYNKYLQPLRLPISSRLQNQLDHIFSGAYAAGLYSYEWADIMSTNAYNIATRELIGGVDIDLKIKSNFFETGGTTPACESIGSIDGRILSLDFYASNL